MLEKMLKSQLESISANLIRFKDEESQLVERLRFVRINAYRLSGAHSSVLSMLEEANKRNDVVEDSVT